eukprot:950778-Lingulodinium_polyedra.AAC.1
MSGTRASNSWMTDARRQAPATTRRQRPGRAQATSSWGTRPCCSTCCRGARNTRPQRRSTTSGSCAQWRNA